MVSTKKFSEFTAGGDLPNDAITVGLGTGGNTQYNNPWTFLPPGTTGDRPLPDPSMYFRLRLNTTTQEYEFYDSVLAVWSIVQDSESILPLLSSHAAGEGASLIGLENQGAVSGKFVQDLADSALIAQTDNGTIANGQFLDGLATGIVKNTTATGVLSILTGSGAITAVINDDTMATASTTNIPTSLSIKNYVDTEIASLGSAWENQTTATVTMATNTGYTANAGASLITFTLPTTSAVGDFVEINGKDAGLWVIAQAAGQQIFASPISTTAGTGGSLSSVNQYDCVRLRCITANTVWVVASQQNAGLNYA